MPKTKAPKKATIADHLKVKSAVEEPQQELPNVLRSFGDMVESIDLPGGIATAVFTGRPELLKAVDSNMSADEMKLVINSMAVMIRTMRAHQDHSMQVAAMAKPLLKECDVIRDEYKAVAKTIGILDARVGILKMDVAKLYDYARFNQPEEVGDGEVQQ